IVKRIIAGDSGDAGNQEREAWFKINGPHFDPVAESAQSTLVPQYSISRTISHTEHEGYANALPIGRVRVQLSLARSCRMKEKRFPGGESSMVRDFKLGRLAMLVGGGPAPGINSVISSVTIQAVKHGTEVLGILDGFQWLVRGDVEHVQKLTIRDVKAIQL